MSEGLSAGWEMSNVNALSGIAGIIALGAITPGPNNLIVLRIASLGGFARALPAMTGIVLGGLLLLVMVAIGGDALFALIPGLDRILVWVGCVYLVWLGARLVVNSFRPLAADADEGASLRMPVGIVGLFGFQFANPKSWVLVTTAVAAEQAGPGTLTGYAWLAGLFVLIPLCCLSGWVLLGSRLMRYLKRRVARAWFERLMGVLLAVSAVLLLISV